MNKKRECQLETIMLFLIFILFLLCDPAGTRTQGPYIKSVLLYQLSYGIKFSFGEFIILRTSTKLSDGGYVLCVLEHQSNRPEVYSYENH